MYYQQYLASLCSRRQWSDPEYEFYTTHEGIGCLVRVNNREYITEQTFEHERLATENAAMRAYMICRNFSVNDGKLPSGPNRRTSTNTLQGRPVPIGTGRRNTMLSDDGSTSSGSRSGQSSPGSPEFPIGVQNDRRRQSQRVLQYDQTSGRSSRRR